MAAPQADTAAPARLALTGAQLGVWYAQQRSPGDPVYNVGQYVEVSADLDPALLDAALRTAVAESEALRSRIVEADGTPYQEIAPADPAAPVLAVRDLSGADDPLGAALADMRADMDTAVDTAAGPLHAHTLYRLGERHCLWYQRYHHVIADAFAITGISRRVAAAYTALAAGEEVPAARSGALADVVAEEAAYAGSERHAADRRYWAALMAGRAEPPLLAEGAPAPPGAKVWASARLGADTLAALDERARGGGHTWADLVTAAYAIDTHRLTGADGVVLGVPAMGRLGSASLRVPSMVVNVLPLCVDLAPATTLGDAVRHTAERLRGLRAHQRYRAEDIRRDLGLVGRTAGLYGPMLNVKAFDYALSFAGAPGISSTLSEGPVDDVSLSVYREGDSGLRFELSANAARYGADAARDRLAEFVRVLTAVATADPGLALGRIDLLSPESRRLLRDGADAAAAAVPDATLPELLARAAARHGGATAVESGGRSLSYTGLHERANRIAHALTARGAAPGRVVAVALPRGTDLVAAMIAVGATGAAVLPLDPDFPAERLHTMLADSGAVLLVGTCGTTARLDTGATAVLRLDDRATAAEIAAAPPEPPAAPGARTGPGAPAYVIYTSGSTGRPKGVVVPQRALVNFLADMGRRFPLGTGDVWPAVTTVGFDISALELYLPLLHSARLVLADRDTVRDPSALAALITASGATIMQATPTLWQALADEHPEALRGLRILVGGEALPPALAATLGGLGATVNLYGPTETTIWSTAAPVTPGAPVTIGGPIANTRVYVLDAALRPVPTGRTGDLYIAGAGLALGYANRAALTAERFTADPFGPAGARMYRTGDIARRRADGALDYLGRSDHQVKIRGFRIELGEIEAALAAHPGVAQAVVAAREDGPGGTALAGYLVAAPGAALDPDEVRSALAARLPEYMVPAALVELDALPLTANRKVDRAALPEPDVAGRTEGAKPRTPAEAALCAVFADVLGRPEVGPDDDFFALGGHSILATRAANGARAALGTDVRVRDLFAAPTAAALAARLADHGAAAAGPTPRERPEAMPLAPAQERLWFLDRLAGPSAAYNVPVAVRLRGAVDADALAAALRDVVLRHESLHTVYGDRDGVPFQRALAPAEVGPLLRTAETTEDGVGALVDAAVHEFFDITADTPVRALLARLRPVPGAADREESVLCLVFAHIATDEWSEGPLLRDLDTAYAARRAGRAPVFPDRAIDYGDAALWQRDRLGDPADPESAAAGLVRHWRAALEGLPEEAALPADRPRPLAPTGQGRTAVFRIDPERHRRLRALAREHGVTEFMAWHAVIATLLHRVGGGTDIAVGAPHAGRDEPAVHGVVGLLLNLLVLRTDLSGAPDFTEVLRRVRAADTDAFAHADLPFDRVVEALNPARAPGRNPLFQVLVSHQHDPEGAPGLLGLDGEVYPVELRAAKADLEFILAERPGADGISGGLSYAADLFDHATAAALTERFIAVLDQVLADPGRPISAIDPVLPAEHAAFSAESAAARHPVEGPLLPAALAAAADRHPGAPAVLAGGTRATYAQVQERAGKIAALLRRRGIGPEQVVAVAMERSADLIAALAAVHRAGAAYLPLDPAFPAARIEAMAADSGTALALTDTASADRLPPGLARIVLDTDAARAELAAAPAAPAPGDVAIGPDSAAYILYTSGSTGTPKGVVVGHGALRNFLEDMGRRVPTGPSDVWAAVTTVGFDISALELFLPLLHGGAVLLADRATVREPRALAALMADHGATVMQATPTLWQALAEERPEALDGLRVLVGGEALPAALADTLAGAAAEVLNVYGPTETTIWSTAAPVAPGAPVTIGGPLANTRLRVLDAGLRPVPAGVPGDLYIAGDGLARGYANRAALTAERFTADPFGPPGARMYRTGDIARRRRDGALDFLGRSDHQVKIRGFRIECGEIESVLAAHPGIARAVVAAQPAPGGAQRLVAHYTSAPGVRTAPEAARAHLAAALPEYMVPAALVPVDAFPLTANGKVDRAALPAPEDGAADGAEAPGRAPADAAEAALCAVTAEVLGRAAAGPDDDFFALGGDSITALRIVALARRRGLELSVRAVFEHRTPARLAAAAGRTADAPEPPEAPGAARAAVPLDERQRAQLRADTGTADLQEVWPLTPLQAGLLVHSGTDDAYVYQLALTLSGPLDPARLRTATEALLGRHPALRAGFWTPPGGDPVQFVPSAAALPWRETDLAGEADTAAALAALERAERAEPFDPARPPLVRAVLARTAPADHVLVLTAHHVVMDGWSARLLVRDLDALYRGAPLPDAVPFSAHLAQRAGADTGAARAAWRAALAGLDGPTLVGTGGTGAGEPHTTELVLPEEADAAVRALARDLGVTLSTVVQAVWGLLLGTATGSGDVVFGTAVSGRRADGTDATVGLLINTVPVRVRIDPAESAADLLVRLRAEQNALLEHDHLGLADIRREAGLPALFDTYAVLENLPDAPGAAPAADGDAHITAVRPYDATHYPLALAVLPEERLRFRLDHRPDLCDPGIAERLLERAGHLLAQIAADPAVRVAALGLLLPGEPAEPAPAHPQEPCPMAAELLRRLAAERPGDTALVAEGESEDFAALDARANRLARLLADNGARPGAVVALALPRGRAAVTAILAVAKTGAAYLPLDPGLPADRLAFMLADTAPAVVLYSAPFPVPPGGAPVIDLDDPAVRAALAARPGTDPRCAVLPDAPAYVIYTSGSTGTPKGVAVPHSALAHLLERHRDGLFGGTGAGRLRVAHTAAFTFDASWDALAGLLLGHELHLLGEDVYLDLDRLGRYTAENAIDYLDFTPTYWRRLLDSGALTRMPGIRVVGGEAFPADLWRRMRALPEGATLNLYGPTEATVDALCADVADTPEPVAGRPLPGTAARVLDPWLRPCPPHVAGELYLAGPALATCYQGRPALTAERFTADPFGPPGTRMYRTGDLARRRADGAVEVLGRADDQVKVRGYRIELGEVEAALAELPGVAQAAAAVREDTPGVRRLAGYLVPEPGAAVDPDGARAALARRLPDFMVPPALAVLPALPVLPSGKVDRAALPAPAAPPSGGDGAAPADGPEAALCAVFAETLGLDRVGPGDDFFALGGDSIVALRAVALARRDGLGITAREVFIRKTPRALAAVARRAEPVAPAGADDPVGALPAPPILRDLLGEGGPIGGYTQRRLVWTPPGLDRRALAAALDALLDHHDALRLAVRPDPAGDPGRADVRVLPRGAVTAAEVLRTVPAPEGPGTEAALVRAAHDAADRLDLAAGRVVQAVFFDAGPHARGRLLLLVHHAAVDGVSWRILLPDLADAVAAAGEGRAPAPAATGTSYRGWAIGLREHAADPARTAELDHWLRVLAPGTAPIAAGPPDPARDTAAAARTLVRDLPADSTGALLGAVPAAYTAGVDDVLLAALAAALTGWRAAGAGGSVPAPFLVEVEGHGREEIDDRIDASRTVGWFTSARPVRLDPASAEDPGGAVKAVKEHLRAAPANGIGFGLLNALNPDTAAALADAPRPHLLFNYLGRFPAPAAGDWQPCPEVDAIPSAFDPGQALSHPLQVNAVALETPEGPVLRAHWTWAPALVEADRVAALADRWTAALTALAAHADDPAAGGFTPSDLPLVDLGQDQIDMLEAFVRDQG